jgi:hypothetical protein
VAEVDPYETSYAEHVPSLSESVQRVAAKRLRKQSEAKGNRTRQEIEGKAPAWKNEGSAKTSTEPKGSSTPFHPGSFSGGLHFNLKRGKTYG